MVSPSLLRPALKFAPKVALMQLDNSTSDSLTKAFGQCGVQTVPVAEEFRQRLAREQFQGCVLRLDDHASDVLEAVRSSRSNNRMIVYGIADRHDDVRRFFKYGINVVLDSAADRTSVLHLARSTCALLLNEFRRYVRIPIVIEVTVECVSETLSGSSREISGGGMSVALTQTVQINKDKVRLSFTLPERSAVNIAAATCWRNGSQIGFQFQDHDAGRQVVKDWINSFLGLH